MFSAELPLNQGFEQNLKKPKNIYSYSAVYFQKEKTGHELGFSRLSDRGFGPLQTVYSFSMTDKGGGWVGYGLENLISVGKNINLIMSFVPGIYHQGEDHNLGGWLMFRSGLSFEYRLSDSLAFGISYDHRSSGDIWEYNPGMETLRIQFKKWID